MKLSEKFEITTVRTDTVIDGDYTYRYTLFIRQSPHAASYRTPLYSIRAELTFAEEQTESREVADAFIDPGHALIFYELCRTHLVMPIHLKEIYEDFEH